MTDCIFCKIINGEIPSQIVYNAPNVTAFRDINPQAPTHILIVPNRHITGVAAAEPEDSALLGKLFIIARWLAEQEGIVNGYRLVVNNGPRAGQSVFHLHVHLLGGRPLGWPPG